MRKAFSMIELVFVIVVIGILAAIAVPRFSASRDDALLTRAKTTIANIRTALHSEQQARILKGDYTPIQNLGGGLRSADSPIFDYFDGNTSGNRILEYPIKSCPYKPYLRGTAEACWIRSQGNEYTYYLPNGVKKYMPANYGGRLLFYLENGRFVCKSGDYCKLVERR